MSRARSLMLAAALLVAAPALACAHAYPKIMDPSPGSTLKVAPKAVVIGFTEALDPYFSSLEVLDAGGKRVDRSDAHLSPHNARQFVVDLSSLAPGTYQVVWHATSVDTHKTHGSYDFTVAP